MQGLIFDGGRAGRRAAVVGGRVWKGHEEQ
jgi:hypothetical protein